MRITFLHLSGVFNPHLPKKINTYKYFFINAQAPAIDEFQRCLNYELRLIQTIPCPSTTQKSTTTSNIPPNNNQLHLSFIETTKRLKST